MAVKYLVDRFCETKYLEKQCNRWYEQDYTPMHALSFNSLLSSQVLFEHDAEKCDAFGLAHNNFLGSFPLVKSADKAGLDLEELFTQCIGSQELPKRCNSYRGTCNVQEID
jgi:hypothetical protein